MVFLLSAGNKNDAPEGRKLIQTIRTTSQHYLVADRAYEDRMTREISAQQGFIFVVPPKKTANRHGIMTHKYINVEMKLNVTSVD